MTNTKPHKKRTKTAHHTHPTQPNQHPQKLTTNPNHQHTPNNHQPPQPPPHPTHPIPIAGETRRTRARSRAFFAGCARKAVRNGDRPGSGREKSFKAAAGPLAAAPRYPARGGEGLVISYALSSIVDLDARPHRLALSASDGGSRTAAISASRPGPRPRASTARKAAHLPARRNGVAFDERVLG